MQAKVEEIATILAAVGVGYTDLRPAIALHRRIDEVQQQLMGKQLISGTQ